MCPISMGRGRKALGARLIDHGRIGFGASHRRALRTLRAGRLIVSRPRSATRPALLLLPIGAIGLPAGRLLPAFQELRLWTIPAFGLIFDTWRPRLIPTISRTIELLPRPLFEPPRLANIPLGRYQVGLRRSRFGLHSGCFLLRGLSLGRLIIALLRVLSIGPPVLLLLRHMLLIVGLGCSQYAQIVLG